MTSKEIRDTWLSFFEKKGHFVMPSAALLPKNDKSLLFINAGVTPLKRYFEGTEIPPKNRITNVQKCLRTNDIDNVGRTSRHHTFFEMMGNFSIGDYFRDEALEYAFELLTSPDYFGFPLEKLYFTYYPADIDTFNKWVSLGVNPEHIIVKEDNFWEIGEGPCGPDTEIHYDRGEAFDKRGIELLSLDLPNDRYIEIWNIVFSQFNAKANVKRSEYKELPHKNIDTGAGFERFVCILQNGNTNFDTDLFLPIIHKVEELSGVKYNHQMAFMVIADHARTLTMSLSDGGVFSNVGRGYVLKRILRRALKYGRKLGLTTAFLYELVDVVVSIMSQTYSDLTKNVSLIKKIIKSEEEKFLSTLEFGENMLLNKISSGLKEIDGKLAFLLYDTYGFPIELTEEYAEEYGITVDKAGYDEELKLQKQRSKEHITKIGMKGQNKEFLDYKGKSLFVGYDLLSLSTKVIKVFSEGIVLEKTPFYATSGGQAADKGTINKAEVIDVIKLPNGQHLHKGFFNVKEGDIVLASVDKTIREKTMRNHSSLHILQKALKLTLGEHVEQQGSYVDDKVGRFDFNNYSLPTTKEILCVEKIVKDTIKAALPVKIENMSLLAAKQLGAMALFEDKYLDIVRVVSMDKFSIELCGGTHVTSTADLGDFGIISCFSIGSGIYRIECIAHDVKEKMQSEIHPIQLEINKVLDKIGAFEKEGFIVSVIKKPELLNSYIDILNTQEYLSNLQKALKSLEKQKSDSELTNARSDLSKYGFTDDKEQVVVLRDVDSKVCKELLDMIFDKINADNLFIINVVDERLSYYVKSRNGKAKILLDAATTISGNGGGNEKFAQGASKDSKLLAEVVASIKKVL